MESWDTYFMHLAEESAARSKDPHTKVGACIVKDKRILSLGYNGAPRKFPDNEVPSENSDDLINSKNSYMCHAELNAILNYRGSLSDFENATLYVTHSPCNNCMIALSQVGITKVVYREKFHRIEIADIAFKIAQKCGIEYRRFGE